MTVVIVVLEVLFVAIFVALLVVKPKLRDLPEMSFALSGLYAFACGLFIGSKAPNVGAVITLLGTVVFFATGVWKQHQMRRQTNGVVNEE